MIGGKVRSSKRMSPKRKSPKRKSSKRKSPRTSAWIRKLNAWRKAHRHVDGSLPTMKSAMKHCKGRSARKQKCRKNQGRKPSPKRRSKSPKRRSTRKSKSPKRRSARKSKSPKRKSRKSKSPKRKTSKRKSPKRKTSKRKSPKRKSNKKKSTKKRSYTRKPKALATIASAQRDQMSPFRRYGPRLQQAANALATNNAPFAGPAKKYQPQQQLSPLFGQALPQGLQNFQQQQGPMFGPQTRQQSQARQARQAFEQLPGANTKEEQGGLLGLFGL